MTLAAVTQVPDEIGAPVPLLIPVSVRNEPRAVEIQLLPGPGGQARLHIPGQVVLPALLNVRFEAEQVGFHRQQVFAAYTCIRGVRKRRKIMFAVRADTFPECTDEFIAGPKPDSGFIVRRNVGRIEGAKRRLHRTAARKRHRIVTIFGMTGYTSSSVHKVFATLDKIVCCQCVDGHDEYGGR